MTFAEKLYYLRTENGYSQETLAEILNVSRQSISKWELGSSLPETEKIIAIGELFGVSLDSLLVDTVSLDTKENLDRLVLKFLGSARDMDNISKELVDIVKDGVIDGDEKKQMDEILKTLDAVTKIIHEIKQKMNLQD
ncbi:MAG: helix-turn-helix transcriptional regulator [Lachnospiraceae bacterium]|nr:helix-turn-helix transcriptional regulator [Lachnospiraceae bacterium]